MKLIRAFLAAIAFVCPVAASAQAILQGGPWAPNHVPMYVGQGSTQPIVQDSGPAGGGPLGLGIAEQLLVVRGTGQPPFANAGTGPFKTNWCDYDGPITSPAGYHFLCLSPNAQGGGLITYGAGGAAEALPLYFNVNGITFSPGGDTPSTGTPNTLYGFAGSGAGQSFTTIPSAVTLPGGQLALGSVAASALAAGAATANIGSLGGVLQGTLPSPTFANGSVFGNPPSPNWWGFYLPGSTSPGAVSVYAVSPNAQWGSFLSASRTSDAAGATNVISDTALNVADSSTSLSSSWGRYTETVIARGATPEVTLGHELSVDNRNTDCTGIDPWTYANGTQEGACVGERIDSGIGGVTFTGAISGTTLTVSSVSAGFLRVGYTVNGAGVTDGTYITAFVSGSGGAGTYTVSHSQTISSEALTATSQKISALVDLVNNSGNAAAGFNVDYRAIDTSGGYGPLFKMGPNIGFSWYNGPGVESWRIATTGANGFGSIFLGNNQFDLYLGASNAFHPLSVTEGGVQIQGGFTASGTAPTCSSTGAGTGATCTLDTGSNDISGKVIVRAGTSATASGTIVLTLNAPVGSHNADCIAQRSNGSGSWDSASNLLIAADGPTSHTWDWSNNSVNLTASSTYNIAYHCVGY